MASVSKRKWKHNGKTKTAFIIRYMDNDGARRQKTFDLKSQADEFAFQIKTGIRSGVHIAKSAEATIPLLVRDFLIHAGQRFKNGQIGQGRYENICTMTNRHILRISKAGRFRT